MTRAHVRDTVVEAPGAFTKTSMLRELVRRGEGVGPATDLERWLTAVGYGRRPRYLLGEDADDDIADPIEQPDAVYDKTADAQAADLVDRLGALLDPLLD